MAARRKPSLEQRRKQWLKRQKSKFPPVSIPKDMQVVRMPADAPNKMSDALLELVQPFWEQCTTPDALNKLLTIGMVAWNAASSPKDKGIELIEAILKTLPDDEARAGALAIILALMTRKRELFPDVHRLMVSYSLSMTAAGPHIEVLSVLESPE